MEKFIASGKEVKLYSITGTILSGGVKTTQSELSGYGNHNGINIYTTTTIRDQFFLVDDNGKEHAFQLQDFDIACREGNRLKIVWAIPQGQKRGPYVAVQNLSTGDIFFNDKQLAILLQPVPIFMLLGVLLSGLVGWQQSPIPFLWAFLFGLLGFGLLIRLYSFIGKQNAGVFKKAFEKSCLQLIK